MYSLWSRNSQGYACAVQMLGNDHAVAFAGQQGHFQLNMYKPVMLHNAITPIELLADTSLSFCDRCATGIEPNLSCIKEHLDNCLMMVTALNSRVGYEKAARISHRLHITKISACVRLR